MLLPFKNHLTQEMCIATTKDGALHLTLDQVNDPINNHNLNYKSGMVKPPQVLSPFTSVVDLFFHRFSHGE